MKLYFFSSGILESTKGLFVNGGGKTPFNVPVPFFLIQHKGKNILFDTGNHKDDQEGHLLKRLIDGVKPVFSEEEWAPKAIEKVGLKAEDIDFIIVSHLHHDHAGAIAEFPNATVIVQKSEYDYVRRPDYFMTQAYYNDEAPAPVTNFNMDGMDALEMNNVDWYFLDGWNDNKFDLFGDGKIVIYFTPGHSVGHQSLLVRTDNDGSFLLAADACYVEENISSGVLPGLVVDCQSYLQNLKTFRLLEKTGVKIVTGHDPESWQSFKHAPEYYQ
ncbi:MAG: N-acyl homoserine lactonase family protein [Lachnospiraceae bacterium]|nr:N-acyl homoserine lactonase family protein [Lachnospiraceae bacterium]